MLWLHESHNLLRTALQGELTPRDVAVQALAALGDRLGCPVGALYRLDGERLHFVGGLATAPGAAPHVGIGEGQLGEAVRTRKTRIVRPVEASHLAITSSLGASAPAELLLAPLLANGAVVGAVELGRLGRAESGDAAPDALLDAAAETVGVALHGALMRERVQELLEETQRRARSCRRSRRSCASRTRSSRSRAARCSESQAQLENQQAELEQTNAQLEEQTPTLERQQRRRCSTPQSDWRQAQRAGDARAATSPSSSRTCRTSCARRSTAR